MELWGQMCCGDERFLADVSVSTLCFVEFVRSDGGAS